MRASVDAAVLATAMRDCVAAKNSSLDVLRHVLIVADEGTLTISSTDMELYVTSRIAAEVAAPGRMVVRGDLLRAAASGGGQISLSEDEGFMLVKRGARSRVRVASLPVDHWPDSQHIAWQPLKINPVELANAIDEMSYAAGRNDVRRYLNCLALADGAVFAADGNKAVMRDADVQGSFLIPVASLQAIRRALEPSAKVLIGSVNGSANSIAVESDGIHVASLLLSEKAVNVRAVFPKDEPLATVDLDRAALKAGISRILPFCHVASKAGGWRVGMLNIGLDGVIVEVGKALDNSEDLTAAIVGPVTGSSKAGINLDYLSGMIDSIDAKIITVCVYGESPKHRYLFSAKDGDTLHLHGGCSI